MSMFSRRRDPDDFSDEVRAHLEHEEAELRAAGLSAGDARAEARRRFGNVTRARERVYEASRVRWLETLWQDVKYSVRLMRRSPAFSITAVVVLSLGIGINTALFSVVNALFFKPLPVRAPEELRYVHGVTLDGDSGFFLSPQAVAAVRDSGVFSGVSRVTPFTRKVRAAGITEFRRGEIVSPTYLGLLGIAPLAGREFAEADASSSATPVVIIGEAFWRSRFLSDPAIVGRTIELDESRRSGFTGPWKVHTVIGVLPERFTGVSGRWQPADFWLPAAKDTSDLRFGGALFLIGRLTPAMSEPAAQEALRALSPQFQRNPSSPDWFLFLTTSDRSRLPFDAQGRVVPERLAAALMFVTATVLAIAAANLAGVMTARGLARRGEIGVRLALGAGRGRVRQQLLTEGLLLAVAGAALGVACADVLLALFQAFTPAQFSRAPGLLAVSIDGRVLAVTTGLAIVAGTVIGIVPARGQLRSGSEDRIDVGLHRAETSQRSHVRYWVVMPQVALSLVLLLAAGAVVRTEVRADALDPGYRSDGVSLVDFDLPLPPDPNATPDEEREWNRRNFELTQRVVRRTADIPGVDGAGLVRSAPGSAPIHAVSGWFVKRDGFPNNPPYWMAYSDVSTDHFSILRIPLRHGRLFDERDRPGATPVAVVSETTARWLWPAQSAIGQHVARYFPEGMHTGQWIEVIGVVGDVAPPISTGWNPAIYTLIEQRAAPSFASTLLVRGSRPAGELAERIRQAIGEVNSHVQVTGSRTLADAVAAVRYPRRMAAALLSLAGLLGLGLASIGLYGVMSYSMQQRVREFGIRSALGANRWHIVRLVLRDGLVVLVLGAAAGVALTYGAIRAAARMVAPLPPFDVPTLLAVPLIFALVVALACYLPARRAGRVDPIQVLRSD
jgi:predicted permease